MLPSNVEKRQFTVILVPPFFFLRSTPRSSEYNDSGDNPPRSSAFLLGKILVLCHGASHVRDDNELFNLTKIRDCFM